MITQNLFNKQPKTFMDYEPGKVPSKKDWESPSITKSPSQNTFESNVKIVGDDVTERDYDDFFEGFKSEITPKYDQMKSYSQKTEEAWNDKRREAKEKRQRNEDLLQKIYVAQVNATTPFPANRLRIAVGNALENHVREKHYERNKYNVDLPKTENEAIEQGWERELADCHQNTAPKNKQHIKYVSPNDKHREVIFNYDGTKAITAVEDEPTYNYANPDWDLEHGAMDVLPWIRYGNEPEDSTTWYERIGGALGFGR